MAQSGKLHRVWTARHYRPALAGAIIAAVYANLVRYAAVSFGIELPEWAVPVTAQAAFWIGLWFGRLAWFD